MNPDQVNQWKDKAISYLLENGPKLASAVAILVVGFIVARFLGNLVQRWLGRKQFEPPVRMLMTRLVVLAITAIALVIALGTCGINIAPLVAMMGVAGVGIGLAMQGVLANLVSGLLIIFTKPFRVGEYVEIVGNYGQVMVIELFSTTLQHPDRSLVVIPNRKISGEILHNYGTIRQHDITVGVAYNTDLPRALAIVNEVMAANPRVLKDPAPVAAVKDFGDFSINIDVKPWSNLTEFGAAAGELKLAIADAFRVNRIEIPFPQREVRVLNASSLAAVG